MTYQNLPHIPVPSKRGLGGQELRDDINLSVFADSDLNLKEWSFVRCVVEEVKSNGFIIKLSNEKKKLNKSQLDLEGLHRDHLQPGALVNCSLVKVSCFLIG